MWEKPLAERASSLSCSVMSWVPLHVHSQYSITDSVLSVLDLVQGAKSDGMRSLALTDQGNLFGAVEFYKTAVSQGIKPIIGLELFIAMESRKDKAKKRGRAGFPIILLAKSQKGYHNLAQLSSLAHLEGFYYVPRADKELLEKFSADLICLSGSAKSLVADLILQNDEKSLYEELEWFRSVFGEDYYLEISRHLIPDSAALARSLEDEEWLYEKFVQYAKDQAQVGERLQELSRSLGIGRVATNDARYLRKEDWLAHEAVMNIGAGEVLQIWDVDSQGKRQRLRKNPKRKLALTRELYFVSQAEMVERFSDDPEAIETTLKIAEQCNFSFDFDKKFYPLFVPPSLEGREFSEKTRKLESAQFLRNLCQEGIPKRYTPEALQAVAKKYPNQDPLQVVHDRLKYELDLILSKELGDYLLIVYELIHWAQNNDIMIGPGRGSGAGSIICYLIGITSVDPLRFHLFFERFINPERMSYPDIDIDVCMEKRGKLIQHVVGKYGKSKVAQIATFGRMKARMVIKDVGRVLNVSLSKVNEIVKMVPEDLNITLEKALEVDEDLQRAYQDDLEVTTIIDLAKKLEGGVRNVGVHGAGVIVCADTLLNHVPLCQSKDAEFAVTQYSVKSIESVGMLKIDLLGLKTLTSIQHAVKNIRENEGVDIQWDHLPLDDETTYALLRQGRTLGVFQLESEGMKDLIKQVKIHRFEEIIAVCALYRPGPMEMIPSFIRRKFGLEEWDLGYPEIADILEETYGIMVYQEQVMQIAQKLAGFSLGQGDILRRAMGKKDQKQMESQRALFAAGCKKNGCKEEDAMLIFNKIEKFAAYGFNKSHATAYGYVSYVTAYLKANYPAYWMGSLMTSDHGDLTKVAKIIWESWEMGIEVLPPDVNKSSATFVPAEGKIRYALSAIRGLGDTVCLNIIQERKERGFFSGVQDFVTRMLSRSGHLGQGAGRIGKKTVEVLILSGAFDFVGWPKGALLEELELHFDMLQKESHRQARGEGCLFDFLPKGGPPPSSFSEENKFSDEYFLHKEKEMLGFYLTGHPLKFYEALQEQLGCHSFVELLKPEKASILRIACVVEKVKIKISSKGSKKFAILTISDGRHVCEVPVWHDIFERSKNFLQDNALLYLVVSCSGDDLRTHCHWIQPLAQMVDPLLVTEGDEIFDQARENLNKEKPTQPKKRIMKEEDSEEVLIHVNLSDIDLGMILQIKQTLQQSPGSQKVRLFFMQDGACHSTLVIPANWGVSFNDELNQALQGIHCVERCFIGSQESKVG